MVQLKNHSCTSLHFFIFCPHKKTWKIEPLHQLCSAIKQLGYSASMWYTDENFNNRYNSNPQFQQKYNVTSTNLYRLKDIDQFNSVWILPDEYPTDFFCETQHAKQILWYLNIPKHSINQNSYDNKPLKIAAFLFQSQKGLQELNNKITQPLFQLTDFIDSYFMCSEEELKFEKRIRQIVFNNKEGHQHIIALRSLMPDVRFIGIPEHASVLKDLGLKSCIYLDFGKQLHVSQELRILTSLGCVPLAFNQGILLSHLDTPFYSDYKIKKNLENEYDYEEIKNSINSIFWNFDEAFTRLQSFRSLIRDQNQKFYSSVQLLLDQLS